MDNDLRLVWIGWSLRLENSLILVLNCDWFGWVGVYVWFGLVGVCVLFGLAGACVLEILKSTLILSCVWFGLVGVCDWCRLDRAISHVPKE